MIKKNISGDLPPSIPLYLLFAIEAGKHLNSIFFSKDFSIRNLLETLLFLPSTSLSYLNGNLWRIPNMWKLTTQEKIHKTEKAVCHRTSHHKDNSQGVQIFSMLQTTARFKNTCQDLLIRLQGFLGK